MFFGCCTQQRTAETEDVPVVVDLLPSSFAPPMSMTTTSLDQVALEIDGFLQDSADADKNMLLHLARGPRLQQQHEGSTCAAAARAHRTGAYVDQQGLCSVPEAEETNGAEMVGKQESLPPLVDSVLSEIGGGRVGPQLSQASLPVLPEDSLATEESFAKSVSSSVPPPRYKAESCDISNNPSTESRDLLDSMGSRHSSGHSSVSMPREVRRSRNAELMAELRQAG
mmetsp:Transcript_58156/g.151562  ORF Transcript_58156/g.151562 Transcript_58156/m.151562 type:complete len:226 (-) Transcript_58156:101-778(-)